MVTFFCGVIVLTLIVIAIYPRSYSSESKLLLRVGRESVSLDPTATTGETIMLQKTQADEIASALNILTSRTVLERVAEQVGAERINDDLPTSGASEDGGEPSIGIVRRVGTLRIHASTACCGHCGCPIRRRTSNWRFVACRAGFAVDSERVDRDFDQLFGRVAGACPRRGRHADEGVP